MTQALGAGLGADSLGARRVGELVVQLLMLLSAVIQQMGQTLVIART